MCGIVGYTGPREAGPILLEGLRRLEYRGYDSAGIALVDERGDLFVEKRAGKLAEPPRRPSPTGRRTRPSGSPTRAGRPTAGPNDLNAHPHRTARGDITVIHNGIIENFRELRDGLVAARPHAHAPRPTPRRSPTSSRRPTRATSPRRPGSALAGVEGAYALAVMHRGEPDRLVGARMNVPLVVGLGDGETFLACDVAAILAAHRPGHLPRGGRRRRPPTRAGVDDHRRRRARPASGS